MFQAAAWLVSQFYNLTSDYTAAIALVAVVIMMLIFPLTLKSTKSMLEMQKVQPEMKRLVIYDCWAIRTIVCAK